MSQAREVVITGLGVVSPIGVGREAFWSSLVDGRSGVRPLVPFDAGDFAVRFGAQVTDFDGKKFVTQRKSLKVMSRDIQLGYAAAQMAYQDAGLTPELIDPDRMGVVFGADMIRIDPQEMTDAFRACTTDGKFNFEQWGERALGEMFPLWMLKYLPNMPACHIAIAHDARGPNNSITLTEVSSLLALAESMRVIESGKADVIIAGGTGSRIHPMSWLWLDKRQISHRSEDPAAASRPFELGRDGMVYGEGSAAYIVENRQHAEARGANILARVLGYSSTFEPGRNGKPPQGVATRTAIRNVLASARLTPADIGHVNAHGLSTVEQDRTEAQAIRDELGDVPVTAPKSFFGNLGAGTGAVEMAASLLSFSKGQVPFTLNYDRPDPQCPIEVIHGRPHSSNKQTALLLNQATMGQSVAVVLAGPN